jgi:asparagine synthase (glutamine-hydrolysing)
VSAFALLFHRDAAPAAERALAPLLARLRHRGPDGQDAVAAGGFALGHLHFWTTPEEVGERQPLADPAAGLHLVFDGRLDNRDELLAALGLGAEARRLSDAALVLAAYRRWGDACLERLLGPCAVAIADARRRRVLCGRDALGDRTLFYVLRPELLAVASEESALLALPGVEPRLDERSLARFFAVEPPAPGDTFFAAVRELPPAHGMAVEPDRVRTWRHWQPPAEPRLRLRRDADYAERFGEVLAASVRARLRTTAPVAVLMSGGLDSTAVAAVAARQLAGEAPGRNGAGRLRAVSWVFDELAGSDERRFIEPVVERWALQPLWVWGDDAWPLAEPATWPRNPNTPLEGLYRRLHERAYAAARSSGAVVVLTGEYGDDLYAGGDHWLADLLREGRLAAAAGGLAAHAWAHGFRRLPTRHRARSAVGRALGRRAGALAPSSPQWLLPGPAVLAAAGDDPVPSAVIARRPWQHRSLLDPGSARAAAGGLWHAARAGVDARRPYRDRRLVELALDLPAHQLWRPGWSKWVLRQAMCGLLPEPVRLRRVRTSLLPLCARGLLEREADTVRGLLAAPDALWRRFVREDWLARVPGERFRRAADGPELVVPWLCVCAELWTQANIKETR